MKVLISEQLGPHRYKDNHGYLICTDCVLARTGKQTYTRDECFNDGDSSEIEIDRKEKDVFDPKTLASFENVPITIEHPDNNVDPDNYNSLSVGYIRNIHKGIYQGKPVMMGTAVLTDAEGIEKVESGELTNLSCGYDCDVDDGKDPHQFNIRGNHVALCEVPRAGITHIQDSLPRARRSKPLTNNRSNSTTKTYIVKADSYMDAVRKVQNLKNSKDVSKSKMSDSASTKEELDDLLDEMEGEEIYLTYHDLDVEVEREVGGGPVPDGRFGGDNLTYSREETQHGTINDWEYSTELPEGDLLLEMIADYYKKDTSEITAADVKNLYMDPEIRDEFTDDFYDFLTDYYELDAADDAAENYKNSDVDWDEPSDGYYW